VGSSIQALIIIKEFSLHLILCILSIEIGVLILKNLPPDPMIHQAIKGLINSALSFIITNFVMRMREEKDADCKNKKSKKKKKKKGRTDKLE
jgi:hypothetical protein